ncbi:hypothetical protein ZWY2020_005915 [Hordeum vulgare]|nr:hypothetical protein ZWY2020_005915 [Hordeum vulgare]
MAPDPLNNASNSYYMLLRELFLRLVLGLQVESSLSMEIIAFWLWLQQGNGQVGYLQHIYSFNDNHFHAIVSSAKRFLELLHFGFDGREARSVPRSAFQRQAIEGISLYFNNICYEALEDLRERIEMNFVHNQMTYLRQKSHGQSMTDRVPISTMTDLYPEVYGESSNEQIPKSTKHLLTKIKALYANTPKHHGEGTNSRNIHVQTSQMHHGEGSSSRNIHAQTCHMLRHDTNDEVYDYQSTSRLVTLLDKLSLRENHNDAITQHQSDVPPDERTLFVTFSNGYPLTKDELHEFFMRHYGDIEEISVEEPIERRPPLYAHVTFYSQMTLFHVLDGNRRVKFMIRGKHLWARQYVPKKKKKTDVFMTKA